MNEKVVAPLDRKDRHAKEVMTLLMQFSASRKVVIPHTAELARFIASVNKQSIGKMAKIVSVNSLTHFFQEVNKSMNKFKAASEDEKEPEHIMNAIEACQSIIYSHMCVFMKANGYRATATKDGRQAWVEVDAEPAAGLVVAREAPSKEG